MKRTPLHRYTGLARSVLYRGRWVLLGDDGSITPTYPPVAVA